MGESEPLDLVQRYLQADAPVRAGLFREFRKALRALAADRSPEEAADWARRAVSRNLDYSSLQALRRLVRPAIDAAPSRDRLRIAVLGGSTTIQLVELLELFLASFGIPFELYEAEYGIFRQEILTPGSLLDRFSPQLIVLATGAGDVGVRPGPGLGLEDAQESFERELEGWERLWERAGKRWGATVVQNRFDVPPYGVLGHFGARHLGSRERLLERLNEAFAERAPAHVVLHDLRALVLEQGADRWYDPRFYHEAKLPCGPDSLVVYAHSLASVIRAIAGKSKKVLVLDLDNTLWGGVIGDVGVEGIALGQGSGQGEAFLAFQAYARELHDRGIVLAVCSKNDDANAREPFERRSDLPLTMDHFACFVANWRDKPTNLREIAERLELGIDSLVFIDDNPAERAVVRRQLPEVAVPDLPEDPALYVRAVASQRYFEPVSFTREDAERVRYYAQNARRKEMAADVGDLEEFLASLGMCARLEPVTPLNRERVAQLVNKSNQFNLTTRRRTLPEVERLAKDPDWRTLTVSLRDELGDNGLISVIFLRRDDEELSIDTWLMSCRVLQRGVEQLVTNHLVELARREGCTRIRGEYIPSARNAMVRDHYPHLGFREDGSSDGATRWVLDVERFEPHPHHIEPEEVT
ncbi:MAG: HAD-IIIC family phosphatase [Myxococcota bacterium]